MRTHRAYFFVVLVSPFLSPSSAGSVLADADGFVRTILDGVRASRLGLREGSVEIHIQHDVYVDPPECESYSVTAEWKDGSVRFLETHADGSPRRCSIRHNGELLFRVPGSGGAVMNLDDDYANFIFDPRILGASPWLSAPETARELIFPSDSKWEFSLQKKSDPIDNAPCVVVRWETNGIVQDYWIDVENGFLVRKIVDYNNRYEFVSQYADGAVLPDRITCRRTDRERKRTLSQTTFDITNLQLSPIEDKVFSMAGLQMEIGEPMADARLQERIGFWNGEGLSSSFAEALAVASSREPVARSPTRWALAVLGILGLLLGMLLAKSSFLIRRACGPVVQSEEVIKNV